MFIIALLDLSSLLAKAQYLQRKYLEMKYEAKQKTIKNRFKYLKKMIEEDFKTEQ